MCQKNNNIPAAFFSSLLGRGEGVISRCRDPTLLLAENEVVRMSSSSTQVLSSSLSLTSSPSLSSSRSVGGVGMEDAANEVDDVT